MKTIPLTGRRLATMGLVAIVDDADYPALSKLKWNAYRGKNTFYATNGKVRMHQIIMPGSKLLDHINGNGLDNRRENLRFADDFQNNWNRRKTTKPKSSQYKGVCFCNTYKRWKVALTASGKTYVARFRSEEEAAKYYDVLALKFHGAFAVLNFPVKGSQ